MGTFRTVDEPAGDPQNSWDLPTARYSAGHAAGDRKIPTGNTMRVRVLGIRKLLTSAWTNRPTKKCRLAVWKVARRRSSILKVWRLRGVAAKLAPDHRNLCARAESGSRTCGLLDLNCSPGRPVDAATCCNILHNWEPGQPVCSGSGRGVSLASTEARGCRTVCLT